MNIMVRCPVCANLNVLQDDWTISICNLCGGNLKNESKTTASKIMHRMDVQRVVEEIMTFDGPDGRTDGSNTITDFIMALQLGGGEAWAKNYAEKE